jgi:hypothetical protein
MEKDVEWGTSSQSRALSTEKGEEWRNRVANQGYWRPRRPMNREFGSQLCGRTKFLMNLFLFFKDKLRFPYDNRYRH